MKYEKATYKSHIIQDHLPGTAQCSSHTSQAWAAAASAECPVTCDSPGTAREACEVLLSDPETVSHGLASACEGILPHHP